MALETERTQARGKTGLRVFLFRVITIMDRFIPEKLLTDPETSRRATLVARFGTLGSLFGLAYTIFYLAIGHRWGAGIVITCSLGFAVTPWFMRRTGSADFAGHFFALDLTIGFLALCFVEGGVHGHAIAWLASVPLCALLLIGVGSAGAWLFVAFCATAVVVGLDLAGYQLPNTCPAKWTSVITAAGYLSLVTFMLILGSIFETGRAEAAEKMQKALAELAASNQRLIHVNNEKNEFLGIAAHDLKNPLGMILFAADMMRRTELSESSQKRTETIISLVKRMSTLVNNLLDVNAIEAGRFNSKPVRCDMGLLLEECAAAYQAAAAAKKIAFRIGVSNGLHARADRLAATQILDNLISNAIKFSPLNTTIHLHAMPEKDFILVTVRDEGPGITEEDQKKLFSKYCRLTARPTANESSTGLGLSIVKRLAETMAGSIQCSSAPGVGASFSLRLPLWPDLDTEDTTESVVPAGLRRSFHDLLTGTTRN